MRQGRGLEREIGLLIVGVACWPGQGRLQAGEVTELVAGLRSEHPKISAYRPMTSSGSRYTVSSCGSGRL
jgi:hypothetical protein